ncbi:MAG TPA: biopolymer transporter ExbD [Elusimicrobiota bacterium]|nr:biopolymer transporter ExbD [Elusimicrobiota bacterium]
MAGSLSDESPIVDINITPLVDVCLVLVIIFMVTAPMMSDPAIKVTLPKAHTREGEEKDKITLTLGKDGDYALDYEKFPDVKSLTVKLKEKLAESDSKMVILRADKDALNGQLTDLMARAKDAGALSMTIATDQEK